MADSPLQKNLDSSRNWLWKWLLLTLCVVSALGLVAFAINVFGLGGHPWYGIWGIYNFPTGQPYVERFDPPQPGLAAARAGIRAGDWMDLRDQNLTVRIGMFAQPMAMQPIPLVVHRGARRFMTSLIPTTMWEDRTSAFRGTQRRRGICARRGGDFLSICSRCRIDSRSTCIREPGSSCSVASRDRFNAGSNY